MRILVTGGTGFIGTHVIQEVLKRGMTPVLFDRYIRPSLNVEFFRGDVTNYGSIQEAVAKVDAVINLAGILGTQETIKKPIPSVETNVIGALNVFEACIPSHFHAVRVVQIGVGNHWMDNPYSITKDMAVRFAHMYNKEHRTKIAMLRVLNAYGPGQKAHPIRKVIPTFIERALNNEDIEIYGDGEQIMDMVYVKDVAEALVDCVTIEHDFYDKPMDFGTGRRTTVNWIAEQIIKACNSKSRIVHLPMRPGEVEGAVVLADPSTMLLKEYKMTPFEDGIIPTVEYYKCVNNH